MSEARVRDAVGVGIVGLGGMGHLHARSVTELGATIVAGADISSGARGRFGEEFGATTYDDHTELITDDAVDAVIVTTPNRFHEPIAVAALEAGCDVLVEKPLAHTLESAERIAATAARTDGICMVGFHNRHAASSALFDAHRDSFGKLTHIEARYIRRRGIPGPGSWFTNEDLAGGGALVDIGVHALDLALYALEFPDIEEVTGVTRSTFGRDETYADPDGFGEAWDGVDEHYTVDDSVTAFIRCADGQTITLDAAWAINRKPRTELVVQGTDAGAQFDIGSSELSILEVANGGYDHYADTMLSADPSVTGYKEQDAVFLDAVVGETPAENTVEQALIVQLVIDAIYRSSETGQAVSVADSMPELSAHEGSVTHD